MSENKVFISNLPYSRSSEWIKENMNYFKHYDDMEIKNMPLKPNGNHKGFMILEAKDKDHASLFISENQGVDCDGRVLKIELVDESKFNSKSRKSGYGSIRKNNTHKYGVHIKGLDYNLTFADIREYLKRGEESTKGMFIVLKKNRFNSKQNPGWCIVFLPTEEQVASVVEELNGTSDLAPKGRYITVSEYVKKDSEETTTTENSI